MLGYLSSKINGKLYRTIGTKIYIWFVKIIKVNIYLYLLVRINTY